MKLIRTPKGRTFVIVSAHAYIHSHGVRDCACRISDLEDNSHNFFQLTTNCTEIDYALTLPIERRNIAIFNCIASDLMPRIESWMDAWHND